MDNVNEKNYMINDLANKREELFPGIVINHKQVDQQFFFTCDNALTLEVHCVSDSIIRFKFTTDGRLQDHFSYAVPEIPKNTLAELDFTEKDDHFRIITDRLICTISKKGLKTRILNKSGEILCEDEKGFHWEYSQKLGGDIVFMSKKIQGNEQFFGLGDKSCSLDMRSKRLQLWGSDTYGYTTKSDPLYKNIPFYIGLHHKRSYGIFFDNTFRSFFDFGSERSNVSSFFAHGGVMDYYFIYGPEMEEVSKNYTMLTGTPELPPMWALGFHQCKWSYYPEQKVREVTSEFRKRQIPCDAFYLDIDYMEGFRCFTWNENFFPEPKKMVSDLKKDGFKTVVIIDPGIKIDSDYSVYQEGIENDYFCRRADGPLMKGSVWPGLCNFPDYTRPDVREWWSGLFKGLIKEDGVAGVWNDMNEPAVFEEGTFPDDVRHDFDGHPCSHRKAHNIYGMQMARSTNAGVKKFAYPNRPFTITRSGYAGMQRYSSAWTGDNVATWEHLKIANTQCQRLSTSGLSFIGSDIGGFIETPSGELFIRWIQLGIFHPFCRVHSSGDHGDQEPWSFGEEYALLFKKFVELRYEMLPYIYTTFWKYVQEGTPMIKQIQMVAQNDAESHHRQDEFLLGPHLLTAPVCEKGAEGRWMYLPEGNWFYFWTDERQNGHDEIWAEANLERVPLFVKEGAILPFYPVQQYVGEKTIDVLTLHIYYKDGIEVSYLYEDKGDGYEYESGESAIKIFTFTGADTSCSIAQAIEGDFSASYQQYKIVLHGFDAFNQLFIGDDSFELQNEQFHDATVKTTVVGSDFAELKIEK